MAAVRIEDEAFADERYDDLALHAGLADADHARGKMARLWRQCTLEGRYQLEETTVLRVLGTNGIEALIRARLGERVSGGGVRIRGTKGRIEWLRKLRDNGRKGGRPRKVASKPSGLQVAKPSGSPDQNPPSPSPSPSPVTAPSPQRESPEETAPPPAKQKRRIPPTWIPTDKHRELAKTLGVDVAHEASQFHDHFTGKGEPRLDWDASFRTWLRNAKRFGTHVKHANAQLAIGRVEPKAATEYPDGEVAL